MRVLSLIIILLFLPFNLTRSQDPLYTGQDSHDESGVTGGDILENTEEGSVEDEFLELDPEIFSSKKLYYKNLKALSDEEKIKWSFKMADLDIFL